MCGVIECYFHAILAEIELKRYILHVCLLCFGWYWVLLNFTNAQPYAFSSQLNITQTACPSVITLQSLTGVFFTNVQRGSGLTCTSAAIPNAFMSSGWTASVVHDPTAEDYIGFDIYGTGCGFSLDSFEVWLLREHLQSPRKMQLYYRINQGSWQAIGTETDLNIFPLGLPFRLGIDLSSLPVVQASDQLQLRMYAWQSGGTAGSLGWISDVGMESRLFGQFNGVSAGTINGAGTVCAADQGLLTLTQPEGVIQYWEYATAPFTQWNVIGNNTHQQAYSGLTEDRRYRAVVACGVHSDTTSVATLFYGEPAAVMSGDQTICDAQPAFVTVQLSGGGPWELEWLEGSVSQMVTGITANPFLIPITASASTTYQLTRVENACGIGQVTGSARVGIGSNHQVQLSGDTSLCGAGNHSILLVFSSLPPWDITWTDGQTLQTLTGISTSPYMLSVSALQHTTYSLVNSMSGACAGQVSGTAEVQVFPVPQLTIGGNLNVCNPDSLLLNVLFTGTAPFSFDWSYGSTMQQVSGLTGGSYPISDPNPISGLLSITGIQDAHCPGVDVQQVIQVHALPQASISGASTLCEGDTAQILIPFQGTAPYQITWSDGISLQTESGITTNPWLFTPVPVTSTTYQLIEVSDAYCVSTQVSGQSEVELTLLPLILFWGDTTLCAGTTVRLPVVNWGALPWAFQLDINGNLQDYQGIAEDTFWLDIPSGVSGPYTILQASNACGVRPLNITAEIQVHPIPEIVLSAPALVCEGEPMVLSIQGSGTAPWTLYYLDADRPDSIPGIVELPFYPEWESTDSVYFVNLSGIRDSFCYYALDTLIRAGTYPRPTPGFIFTDTFLEVHFYEHIIPRWDSLRWTFGDLGISVNSQPKVIYERGGEHAIQLEVWDSVCYVVLDTMIQVRELYKDFVVIHENPNNGDFRYSLHFLSKDDRAEVQMISREGVILYEETVVSEGGRVMRELQMKDIISPGLYFLRVWNRWGVFYAKVMVIY